MLLVNPKDLKRSHDASIYSSVSMDRKQDDTGTSCGVLEVLTGQFCDIELNGDWVFSKAKS